MNKKKQFLCPECGLDMFLDHSALPHFDWQHDKLYTLEQLSKRLDDSCVVLQEVWVGEKGEILGKVK